jgi:integrase
MASFRKRGTKWQTQIRRDGFPHLAKTFQFKEDAIKWAREQERLIDKGEWESTDSTKRDLILSEILTRYENKITPKKRAAESEHFHLRIIQRHPIAKIPIKNLTPSEVCRFRDDRLNQVSPSTVRKEIGLLQRVLKIAHKEWGINLNDNLYNKIVKPPSAKARERRLDEHELSALENSLSKCRNALVRPIFFFAVATGMRRGEILSLQWSNIDFEARTALLPLTKNGDARTVPLSSPAIKILEEQQRAGKVVFPISANAFRLSWERVKERAKINDLHFHDLRHEAISRFFELGLSIPEVALISGHRDFKMLARYVHLRPSDVARKLQ